MLVDLTKDELLLIHQAIKEYSFNQKFVFIEMEIADDPLD